MKCNQCAESFGIPEIVDGQFEYCPFCGSSDIEQQAVYTIEQTDRDTFQIIDANGFEMCIVSAYDKEPVPAVERAQFMCDSLNGKTDQLRNWIFESSDAEEWIGVGILTGV